MSEGHTERFTRRDLDGIVDFGGERPVLHWQSTDLTLAGYVHFIDRNEKIEPTWIRAVCQSLRLSVEAELEPSQQGQLGPNN